MHAVQRILLVLISAASGPVLISCTRGSPPKPSAQATVVNIDTGSVRGVVTDGVLAFKGVPYA